MLFLRWANYILTGIIVLRLAWMALDVLLGTLHRTAQIRRGDTRAAFGCLYHYQFHFSRYCLSIGDSNLGIRGIERHTIVDPAHYVEGKPVVVGHSIQTKLFTLTWGLAWPYP